MFPSFRSVFMAGWALLSFVVFLNPVLGLNNGVAKLPVLGYNTWNAYQCDIDEDLIVTTAKLMKSLGLQDAGYSHVNLDDCWAEKNRTSTGAVVPDTVRFKSGMKALTTQIHALGFKAGIYSDSGWFTCAGYPGSFEHEEQDAQTFFQEWGFDYLKYDNCAKYQRMADAIASVSQNFKLKVVFSLCEWGWSQVWLWGSQMGHSWRTTGDIGPNWPSLTAIINFNSFITQATDFYGRNDLDMLQLGNGGLTYEEAKSHFTAWALMKSPLLIGTNLSAITNDILGILKNTEILAINQDPVEGSSISPFRWGINPDWTSNDTYPAQYWSGPSQNGTVVMLLNTLDGPSDLFFNLTESPWIRAGRQYSDLWTHTDNGTAVRNFTAASVAPHGVVALLLKDAGDEPSNIYPDCAVWFQCTAENGTHVGG
ncbi:hypothetical protein EW146_g3342 [Bondarzewia mesenterica]|uniref:Alpha-galactosidase n=1 Tax=Bondarzewia mesenterica TaxID=1095465 RepID=A0A4V3XFH3_9AGAM|nr:hypothetical protein EW146_g3342 [Bondarzewia mesenterica]